MTALATIPASEARLPQAASVVYFIQSAITGSVKIGWTTDLAARLAGLQTGHDGALFVVRQIQGGRATERWLHRRFASLRLRGEWFEYCPEMLTIIPPDEIIAPAKVTIRRDVRLTLSERLQESIQNGEAIGLSSKQILTTFVTKLTDEEAEQVLSLIRGHARELREYIHTRSGQAA